EIINSQNYNSVEIWDAHSDVSLALLNNLSHVSVCDLFEQTEFFKKYGACNLISPDAGATKKVSKLAEVSGLHYLQAEKHRDPNTGKITHTQVHFEKAHKLLDKFGWDLPFLIV